MVTRYGMSEKLGNLTFGKPHENIFLGRDLGEEKNYSEQTAWIIDQEVRRIVDDCYTAAKNILTENKDKLELLANTLLEKEVMYEDEVKKLLGIKKEIEVVPDADKKKT